MSVIVPFVFLSVKVCFMNSLKVTLIHFCLSLGRNVLTLVFLWWTEILHTDIGSKSCSNNSLPAHSIWLLCSGRVKVLWTGAWAAWNLCTHILETIQTLKHTGTRLYCRLIIHLLSIFVLPTPHILSHLSFMFLPILCSLSLWNNLKRLSQDFQMKHLTLCSECIDLD